MPSAAEIVLRDVPASCFSAAMSHPCMDETIQQVDNHFLQHWLFPSATTRKKFIAAGFSRVTCLYFPKALDDRIRYARAHVTRGRCGLQPKTHGSAEGHEEPDRTIPAEYIFYDLWRDMRAHDLEMADDVLGPVFEFMRAQTDPARLRPMSLGDYFQYRERDVGKALLGALMRFSMGLRASETELAAARPADMVCSKHLSVINDIWSYEKEYVASKTLHDEGGVLCTSVAIVARDAELSVPATKRLLYSLCREWELAYHDAVNGILGILDTPALRAYLDGLVLQMTGNELWSRTTLRYLAPSE